MPILTLINLAFLIVGLWVGMAGLVGVTRFAYRPLFLLGIGGFLISASVLLDLLQLPYVNWMTRFALIAILLFNIKYRATWQQHGITDRQLFSSQNVEWQDAVAHRAISPAFQPVKPLSGRSPTRRQTV